MGRKARHSARTGDGGGELRLRKRQLQAAQRDHKEAELTFFDDPSDKDSDNEQVESEEDEEEEQEVLGLGEEGDSEEEEEEDEEDELDMDNDVDGFDAEAEKKKIMQMDGKWGKSRKNFYSADTAEFELESDEEVAKDEEEAALELQRKQAEMMDDEDFGFDDQDADAAEENASDADDQDERGPVDDEDLVGEQLADIATLADNGFGDAGAAAGASIELVQRDFSKLSKKDKLQIVNQAAPELLGLMGELESTLTDLNEVVTPAIQKLKGVRRRSSAYNRGLQYLVTRQNLLLNYSANISFYLLLRAEGKSVKDHPVLTHLLALKKQMNKMQELDESLEDQLQDLLTKEFPAEDDEAVDDGMDQFFSKQQSKRAAATAAEASKTAKKQKKSSAVTDAELAEAERFYEEAARTREELVEAKKEFYSHEKPELASSDDDSDLEGAKRGASYQIMKNKGLTAHKSKLNRNPRVKKRMQYRKAIIRRKGQVRDVRVGEAGKYGGETTGIKSNLSRSRKIRN